jgi:hypothetical protein
LETFTCGFFYTNNEYNADMDIVAGKFCAKLKEIFDSQDGSTKKSFKFRVNFPNGCNDQYILSHSDYKLLWTVGFFKLILRILLNGHKLLHQWKDGFACWMAERVGQFDQKQL